MDVDEFAREVHGLAVEKGWWDSPRSFGDTIVLIHAELSEAIESYRKGEVPVFFEGDRPDGWAVELADAMIRILDVLGDANLDPSAILKAKHEYNKTRPYRHGGKLL